MPTATEKQHRVAFTTYGGYGEGPTEAIGTLELIKELFQSSGFVGFYACPGRILYEKSSEKISEALKNNKFRAQELIVRYKAGKMEYFEDYTPEQIALFEAAARETPQDSFGAPTMADNDPLGIGKPGQRFWHYDLSAAGDGPEAVFRNMTLTGDCYNSKWGKPQNLRLVLEHTTLTGGISSARYTHRAFSWGIGEDPAGNRICTDPDGRPYRTETVEDLLFGKMPVTYRFPVYGPEGQPEYAEEGEPVPVIGYAISLDRPELLGDVEITVSEPVNNGVIVELKAGSVWNVTKPGYITALTIEAGCTLNGRLLLSGEEIPALPGTYRGSLQVLPAKNG